MIQPWRGLRATLAAMRMVEGTGQLASEYYTFRSRLIFAHDFVMAERTFEAAFLAVVRVAVCMLVNAISQLDSLPYGRSVDETSKIDPFPAAFRPSLSAEHDGNSPGNYRLFQRSQVLTRHLWCVTRTLRCLTRCRLRESSVRGRGRRKPFPLAARQLR